MTAARMTRREATALAIGGAGAILLTGSPFAEAAARRDARRKRLLRGGEFSLGVASGVPMTDGATLWTLVAGIERTGRVELQIAADPQFRRVLVREPALANSVRDFAVKRTIRSPRLRPGEQYWYRFLTRDSSSPVGRFRTALPPDSQQPVRIGFFSCQKWQHGYFTAHRGMAEDEDLDLVVSLGDYIYEEPVGSTLVPERKDNVGGGGDVQSLAEFRLKYRHYKSDPDLIAMHAQHAFAAIWDDHEVEDDYAGTTEGDAQRPRRVPFAERTRAGRLAYFEHLPIPRLRADPFRSYGTLRLGQVELLLLDTRQYRDPRPCPSAEPCPQANDYGGTILGAPQREWLKNALTGSRAAWKVIANQVMMMSLDVPTGVPINADQWDGYPTDRSDVLGHVLTHGVKDVAVLTGDIHTFFAGTVSPTGRVTGTPAATEFVGGSVTSTGIGDTLADMGLPVDPASAATALRAANPHIAYAELTARGYGVLEATPQELRVTYRSPETVLRPGAPIRDLARFRVPRGTAAVEQL